jgi:Holliday junction resolvasome RuvABC endonuclease subunit
MNNIYIGIDPGSSSGCIALIYTIDNKLKEIHTIEFAKHTTKEWYKLLKQSIIFSCNISCVLEKVHGMPGMGVSSVSTFMKNVGHIEMALLALDIPFKEVTPQTWMKYYNLKKDKTESKVEWKRRLREYLQRILPNQPISNNTADAILIAYYTMKTN